MIFPTSIASYRRADLPGLRLLNMYAETAQKVPGQVVLFPRPGMVQRYSLGAAPIVGLFHQPGSFGDALFEVTGGALYSGQTEIGDVAQVGLSQMAVADNALLLASGGGFYRYDGTVLSPIAFPDDAAVSSIAFLGGYAFAARAGTRRFYFAADTTTWDGLDYLSAEQSTDYIVGLAVVVDQLWVFCQRHVEVFFLTGDRDAPLQRVQGRIFDKGALVRDSIVKMDNTVFWVGHDGIVYRGEQTPLRISDHGVEERIATSDPNSISAWSYAWNGHLFYVLHLESETLVYDVATQQWPEAGSYGLPRWRARMGVQVGREIIAGDDVNGQIWVLQDGVYADGNDELERVFTAQITEPGFIDMLALDCSCGEAPANANPGVIEIRTSRDGGRTFTDWRQRSLGEQGQYRKRIGFNRVGMVDRANLLVQFRVTDPRASRVSNLRLNEGRGGRGRV